MTTVNTATNNSASAGQLADRVAQLMECMRRLVDKVRLFDLFLDVRNAAAAILDHTSLQDLLDRNRRVLTRRGRAARERA